MLCGDVAELYFAKKKQDCKRYDWIKISRYLFHIPLHSNGIHVERSFQEVLGSNPKRIGQTLGSDMGEKVKTMGKTHYVIWERSPMLCAKNKRCDSIKIERISWQFICDHDSWKFQLKKTEAALNCSTENFINIPSALLRIKLEGQFV